MLLIRTHRPVQETTAPPVAVVTPPPPSKASSASGMFDSYGLPLHPAPEPQQPDPPPWRPRRTMTPPSMQEGEMTEEEEDGALTPLSEGLSGCSSPDSSISPARRQVAPPTAEERQAAAAGAATAAGQRVAAQAAAASASAAASSAAAAEAVARETAEAAREAEAARAAKDRKEAYRRLLSLVRRTGNPPADASHFRVCLVIESPTAPVWLQVADDAEDAAGLSSSSGSDSEAEGSGTPRAGPVQQRPQSAAPISPASARPVSAAPRQAGAPDAAAAAAAAPAAAKRDRRAQRPHPPVFNVRKLVHDEPPDPLSPQGPRPVSASGGGHRRRKGKGKGRSRRNSLADLLPPGLAEDVGSCLQGIAAGPQRAAEALGPHWTAWREPPAAAAAASAPAEQPEPAAGAASEGAAAASPDAGGAAAAAGEAPGGGGGSGSPPRSSGPPGTEAPLQAGPRILAAIRDFRKARTTETRIACAPPARCARGSASLCIAHPVDRASLLCCAGWRARGDWQGGAPRALALRGHGRPGAAGAAGRLAAHRRGRSAFCAPGATFSLYCVVFVG